MVRLHGWRGGDRLQDRLERPAGRSRRPVAAPLRRAPGTAATPIARNAPPGRRRASLGKRPACQQSTWYRKRVAARDRGGGSTTKPDDEPGPAAAVVAVLGLLFDGVVRGGRGSRGLK